MKTEYTLFLLFMLSLIWVNPYRVSAQDQGTSGVLNRHQIGFNATESIRLFEKESEKTYKVNYRYRLNSAIAFRSGLNYRLDTSGSGMLSVGLKAGMDKVFKRSGNWRFYTGSDLTGGMEKLTNSSRRNYALGLAPFLGVLFYVDEHFSVSTEPGLLMQVHWFRNRDTFNPDRSETWVEMDLVNVGQLVFSLHF